MIKRLFDIVFAVFVLLLTSPLILVGSLAVMLTDSGPAFYQAKRAGMNGRPFNMLKLRTMRVGTDTRDRRITADQDDRITPIGALLRKFKIDELPQFWNVLRGEMSVVGPRPEDWDLVEAYYGPEARRTLTVRPGIAAPVDVLWFPDLTYHDPPPQGFDIQEWYVTRHMPIQVSEGLRYVDHQSMWLDLKVIWQTAVCMLSYPVRSPVKKPLTFDHQGLDSR